MANLGQAGGSSGLARGISAISRSPAARRLVGVRLTGQLADGVLQGALASLVLLSPERATSATGIAAASAVLLVPFTLVGPFAGGVLDRFRRRQILLVAGLVRGLLALGCALAVLTAPDLVVEVGALAYLSVNRLLLAALSASLPRVVAPSDLLAANAVVPTAGSAAALLGGSLALGVRALAGGGAQAADAAALLTAAILSAGAGLLALRLGVASLGPDAGEVAQRSRPASDLLAALRHVVRRRTPALALAAVGLHRLGYGVVLVTALLIARNRLGLGIPAVGALVASVLAVSGAGFFVAAALTPTAVRRVGRRRWAASCCVLAVLPPLAVLVSPAAATLVLASGVLGFAAQGLKIVVDTVVQSSVDDAYRGRVFVLYDVVFNASLIAATALSALLLPDDGWSPPVLASLAFGWLVLAGLVSKTSSFSRPGRPNE